MNSNFSLSCGDFTPATSLYRERRDGVLSPYGLAVWNFLLTIGLSARRLLRVNARNYSRSSAISQRNFRPLNPHRVNGSPVFFPAIYMLLRNLSDFPPRVRSPPFRSYIFYLIHAVLNKLFPADYIFAPEYAGGEKSVRHRLAVDDGDNEDGILHSMDNIDAHD